MNKLVTLTLAFALSFQLYHAETSAAVYSEFGAASSGTGALSAETPSVISRTGLGALSESAVSSRIKVFLPEPGQGNGSAVIVCPGGSYYWLSKKTEGSDVAERLAREGFTAIVLHYRRAGTRYFMFGGLAPSHHYPDALEDVRSAISYVRERSAEFGVTRIGLMGFSAGGHLVLDAAEELSGARPAFVVSLYPVVTMSDESIVHKRSRRALLGGRVRDNDLRERLSMERNIPGDMPPVFLANCKDDPIVDWHNAAVMADSLSSSGIPHEYLQYEKGGHGFGASSEDADWWDNFINWYKSMFDK